MPEGVTPEEGYKKVSNACLATLAKIEFEELAPEKGAKAKRLKFDAKKHLAKYTSTMGGDTSKIAGFAQAMEFYNFAWDIAEFEAEWGACLTVKISANCHDYVKDTVKEMKPAKAPESKPLVTA